MLQDDMSTRALETIQLKDVGYQWIDKDGLRVLEAIVPPEASKHIPLKQVCRIFESSQRSSARSQ